MLKEIIFYNSCGVGDLFNSKEFVRHCMEQTPEAKHYYAHIRSKDIFVDIPLLEEIAYHNGLLNNVAVVHDNDVLYINTWIGRDSKYVLPGSGCTVLRNIAMYTDMLSKYGFIFDKSPILYIPTIDFNALDTSYINNVDIFTNKNEFILLCNGEVFSQQAKNFDFEPIVQELSKGFKVVTTEPSKYAFACTKDIIKKDGSDLNEIGYLSKKARLVVGRSSGPYNFCTNRANYMDEAMTFLTFTYNKNCHTFAAGVEVKAERYWSPATTTEAVCSEIVRCL